VSFSEEKKVNKDLVDLFRTYVQNEVTKLSQEDPESLDELKRHLKYMEKTISGMKESQTKADSRVKVDIRKRTIENATLIQELNQLRSDKRKLELEAKQLQHQVKDYTHKLGQKDKEIEEVRTSMVKQQSSANLPAVNPTPPPRASSARPNKQAPFTGRLYKGPSFENKFVSLQDKQRIVELQNELEERKEQIFVMKMEINQLKEMLSKLSVPEQPSFSSMPRVRDVSP
jgi:predicted  nucleic acid-binding Zn-ribbon protein